MDTHTSSCAKVGDNGRISAEYEAHVRNAGTVALVCALYGDGALKDAARRVSCLRSDQRRHAAARRYARKYVPRGREPLEYMTELIEHVADRYTETRSEFAEPTSKDFRVQTDTALLTWASYGFGVDAPGSGDRARRARASHFGRLHDGAAMVVRRGAGRCINLECERPSGPGDYCRGCASDPDVQRDHNLRRKTIGELWTAVLARRRQRVDVAA